ncbi:hypothetical protein [Limnoglobus roseus]|uniref:hypothetical protein n=1 Tax=Limnoglobus roseus TaxID=2598579 RepID=UPI00143DAA2F|nr:hypothetical protein [Limnoglobus roseus]
MPVGHQAAVFGNDLAADDAVDDRSVLVVGDDLVGVDDEEVFVARRVTGDDRP